jgi:branched-chain amino acid transport system permease protein
MTYVIILGLFGGSIYALAALGIVLTYKTSGIFNFAYGGLAMVCAYAFWQMRDRWHWSQWIAIPLLLLVVAPLLGILLEVIFRPLATASVEIQIVVALGILAFCIALVPIIWGTDSHNLSGVFPPGNFQLGSGNYITWNQLGMLAVAVILATTLSLLLRRTRLGTATRAVVDNRDLAGLIGVNAGTVGRLAWIMSMAFAAISGVMLSSAEGLVVYVLPALIVYAFAPAVAGRLTSLPIAFGGAIAMGVTVSVLTKYQSTGWVTRLEGSIPYLALFALLIGYGSRLKEVRSSLRPAVGAGVFGHGRFRLTYGVAALVAFGFVPALTNVSGWWFSPSRQDVMAVAMGYAVVALSIVVLTGWTGQISIAQMSFAGIGAFTVAHIAGTNGGLFPLAVVVAVLISVPLGLLVGLTSVRLSGLFLALATLAFALLMDNLVFNDNNISGGLTGLSIGTAKLGPISFGSPESRFYLCLVVLGLAAGLVYLVKQGPIGRRLQMVRDAPNAAATLGANLTLTKLAAFAASAALAAVGGCLIGVTQESAIPSTFAYNQSLQVLLLVVLGGRALVSGAFMAGLLQLVQLWQHVPHFVTEYFPLTIAFAVVAIGKEPEGTLAVAARQAQACLALLYRLERRPSLADSISEPGPSPRPAADVTREHLVVVPEEVPSHG